MSRKHRPDADAIPVNDVLTPPWQRLADDFPTMSKKEFKRRLNALSRNDQALAWKAIGDQDPNRFQQAQAVQRKLDYDGRRIDNIAVGAWPDDFKSATPAKLGEFPPGGRETLMRRAKGERRLYPPQYLTTSGHSYDVFVQSVYLGRVQSLLDELGSSGSYRGSIVSVRDLSAPDRRHFNRVDSRMNGTHGSRTNSVSFDGIAD